MNGMELILLAVLGGILLVIDNYTRAEWIRVTGIVLLILAAVLFLASIATGSGSGL